MATKATLSLGLISIPVRLETGVTAEEVFKTVCKGEGPQNPKAHEVTQIRAPRQCATCGDLPTNATLHKAREAAGGLVLLTADEVQQAKAEHDMKFLGKFDLLPHDANEVLSSTVAGAKFYQVVPDGDPSRYIVLAKLIAAHPEYAFACLYTPKSRAGMYVVTVRNGVLLAEERVVRERVKPLPQITGDLNEQLFGMAEAYLSQLATPFDPANYADKYAAAITTLVESREAVVANTAIASVTPIRQSDDDLLAQLAALVPAPKAKTTRKRKEPAA